MRQVYKKLHWTEHSKIKMRQYGLSKYKLINLIAKPERLEKGIAPGTLAVMQTNKSRNYAETHPAKEQGSRGAGAEKRGKHKGEIWLMYKDIKNERKLISAWRYPGISKPGDQIPIPEEIRKELMSNE